MNKGYAFGFLIVLLVVILGLYVAYTGFTASREAQRAQATAPVAQGGLATRPPTLEPASPTPTEAVIPTPMPGLTATLTAMVALNPVEPTAGGPAEPQVPTPAPADTQPPAATAGPVPEAPTTSAAAPTPMSVAAYQFRIAGPAGPDPGNPNCCYIRGTVRDAAGNGLEGVLVQAYNEWNRLPPSGTKGGAEAGQYDIPIGRDKVVWSVIIVDANGNQISTQVQIQYDPDAAGTYRVDWARTY